MRKRDMLALIDKAAKVASKNISDNAASGGMYARGLASEGYDGGYRDALYDVTNLLSGVMPNRYPYWRRQ